jgi:hypothetical protein
MKKKATLLLTLVTLISCFITGCGKEQNLYYGDYSRLLTTDSYAYQKSYLMMDCCEEWNEVKEKAENIENARAIECFEFHVYDENAKEVVLKNESTVYFMPTSEFLQQYRSNYKVHVYDEDMTEMKNAKFDENNVIEFTATHSGIYFVCFEGKGDTFWLSNQPDCTGQCRTCSDLW